MAVKNKTCTSKIFKKGKEPEECGMELLILKPSNGSDPAWICPDCDSLELLPKSMRERIFEQ
jgi:hypothetical protein